MEYCNTNVSSEPLSFNEWLVGHKESVNEACFEIFELPIYGLKTRSVIYSSCRIDPATVSDGLHVYELREDSVSAAWILDKKVKEDFKGTIISISELPIGASIDNYELDGLCTYDEYVKYKEYAYKTKTKPVPFSEYAGKPILSILC